MPYAGDISCLEVWENLKTNAKSALVDVRTSQEWSTIGVPQLNTIGKKPIFAEWQVFPSMQINPEFADEVDAALKAQNISKDDPVFFLCRSGARSQSAAAAMTSLGYSKAYNILTGFEGPPDASGLRGTVSGWQFDKLPWKKE